MQEISDLKQKIEDQEAEIKLNKRLLDRTNQPQSYMVADIERAEKELDFANRKIKQLDGTIKKLKHENESLKLSKGKINDDLQRLLAKRQDIESLQTALLGIIRHSSSKKIDVDDLRTLLADQMRQTRVQGSSESIDISMAKT
jgi:progesterone-induced-blocking factor 1